MLLCVQQRGRGSETVVEGESVTHGVTVSTSGSFESMLPWRNARVHRLDLGLCSHPKEFLGNGVRTHINSKGKIPSTPSCAASRRLVSPTHYQQAISPPPTGRD